MAQPNENTDRVRQLRRNGWSVAGIARYLSLDVCEVARLCGVTIAQCKYLPEPVSDPNEATR